MKPLFLQNSLFFSNYNILRKTIRCAQSSLSIFVNVKMLILSYKISRYLRNYEDSFGAKILNLEMIAPFMSMI